MVSNDSMSHITDVLGFLPSYLSIGAENADYRRLLWEESKRVLKAEWSYTVAHTVAANTENLIRDPISETIENKYDHPRTIDPAINDIVPFFSFVIFRVGLAVAACRYALDGHYTCRVHTGASNYDSRLSGQKSIATEQSLSDSIYKGLRMTLPLSPNFHVIEPADASNNVSPIYDNLRTELNTPNVNTIFRAMAVDPKFLAAVVEVQLDVYDRVPSRWHLERKIRNQYAAGLAHNSARKTHRRTLRMMGYDPNAIDELASHVRAYHENIGTLAVTVLIAAKILDRASSNRSIRA